MNDPNRTHWFTNRGKEFNETGKGPSQSIAELYSNAPRPRHGFHHYEHLRDLRNKLANRNHVEPFMILTDRALRGLASIRPKSLAEEEGIPGIGHVKLHAVAPRFLEAIAKWEKNGS